MFADASLIFSPFTFNGGTPDSLAISSSTASSKIIDVTGAGSGNAPSMVWGVTSTFGDDLGLGDGIWIPQVLIQITTTLTTGTGATLNIALQSAPDNGSNAPGTYTTAVETGPLAVGVLTAGSQIWLPFAPRGQGAALPRFYRLYYQMVAATSFTAGAASAGVFMNRDSSSTGGKYPQNFVVA